MSAHALLAPSAAQFWAKCAGFVTLMTGVIEPDTQAQREGTASHWVAEDWLHSFIDPDRGPMIRDDYIGATASNGELVDEDMVDAAKLYVDDILMTANQRGLLRQLQVEQRVMATAIHEHCWGTPDCWAWDVGANTLYLWDYKYGHSSVSAFENWQMVCYLVGILDQITQGNALGDFDINIVVRIIQPRCYDGLGPYREWRLKNSDLRAYVNILRTAAELAFKPGAQCTTGLHCKNCSAAHSCVALRESTATVIDSASDALPANPAPVELGYELEMINQAEILLKQRKESLEALAEHSIRTGTQVPGWQMEQRYSNRKWLKPKEEVVAMGQLMGLELLGEAELITPAKADEECKRKNVDASVISSYYGTKPTSMKLVQSSTDKARQIFSNQEH